MEAADLAFASAAILAGLCCCAALSPSVKERDEDDDDDDFNPFRAGGIGLALYTDDDGETMAADMCAPMIGLGAVGAKCCCFLGLCGTAIAALVLADQASDPATIHAVAGSVLGLGVLSFCFSWGFGVFPSESGSMWFHRICMGILCCCSIALVPVLVWWRQSSPLFDAAGDAGSGDPDAHHHPRRRQCHRSRRQCRHCRPCRRSRRRCREAWPGPGDCWGLRVVAPPPHGFDRRRQAG